MRFDRRVDNIMRQIIGKLWSPGLVLVGVRHFLLKTDLGCSN